MALPLPPTEPWLIHSSCPKAGQPSTRKIRETMFWKVVQEYVSDLVDEVGNKIATSLLQNFFLCSAASSQNSCFFPFKSEDKRGDIINDILALL